MTEEVETPRAVSEEAPTQEITKEIALDVPQHKEDPDEQESTPQPKKATVGRKAISRLTEDERALIIKNHNEGIYQPYFDVKTLDDGTLKIVKKKPKQPLQQLMPLLQTSLKAIALTKCTTLITSCCSNTS